MKKRVVVIGGGASGLMAAIQAARKGAQVTILEKNEKPGKKLLATGNGRCNLTNLFQEKSCYHGKNQELIWKIIESFPVKQTLAFFEELGIYTRDRNGWVYPYSDQAASVLQVLLLEAAYLKVKLKTQERVESLHKEGALFRIRTASWEYEADAVLVACGSPASTVEGASDDVCSLAKSFGHTVIPFCPSLVPLKGKGSWFSKWAGVRVTGSAALFSEGKRIQTETGELQLTEYGISGIPIFQLSGAAVRAIDQGRRTEIRLDFFHEYEKERLESYLIMRKEQCPYKTLPQLLIGMIPEKLIPLVVPKREQIEQTAALMKDFPVEIKQAAGYKQAQVCSGGELLEELTEHLESIKIPGLYFIGEAADADGRCGGYNLQWAWSSGAVAGRHCSR